MHVEPFVCLRPTPEAAPEFAAPPYDVFTSAAARAYVAGHPRSFLAIDRAETSFDPAHDPYADDVYARARELLDARAADGTLVADDEPALYVYLLDDGTHRQTGVACACAADDFRDGTVRRHELTRADKERDRVRHITATGFQTGPVFLAYRDSARVDALVEEVVSGTPLYDFTDDEGVLQRVWRVAGALADGLAGALGELPRAYIADGHHRCASSLRVCETMRASDPAHTGREAYDYVLAVLFPASQLSILPYDRAVTDANGLDERGLLDALAGAGLLAGARGGAPVTPERPGTFGMHAFGAWRELALREAPEAGDPVASLEVSVLQERVLGPVLGVDDPRTSPRIRYVGGAEPPGRLLAEAGEGGVAFTLYPTTMGQLMAVADADALMPPKSTWFEPKLRSGLFMRRIDDRGLLVDGTRR